MLFGINSLFQINMNQRKKIKKQQNLQNNNKVKENTQFQVDTESKESRQLQFWTGCLSSLWFPWGLKSIGFCLLLDKE